MGIIGSTLSKEPEDRWQSGSSQEHSSENVPKQEMTAHGSPEGLSHHTCDFGEESWLKQIQDLGKVVQHLASENAKLLVINKELRGKCEGQAEGRKDFIYRLDNEGNTGSSLGSGSLVPNKEAIGIVTDDSSENLEALKVKLYENQCVIERLRKELAEKDETLKDLQFLLQTNDDERKTAEEKCQKITAELELMKNEYHITEDKMESLQGQIISEKEQQTKLRKENERLKDELKTVKDQLLSSPIKGSDSENCEKTEACEDEATSVSGNESKEEQPKSLSPKAAAELEIFQNQLKIKREARHKALSAVSAEMERLRQELNTEREAKKRAVRDLEDVKNMNDEQYFSVEVDHLRSKLSFEREEKEKISRQLVQIQKQGNEEIENILKELKNEKTKIDYMQGENKCMKEQLEESDQILQQRTEENSHLQSELESQREKYQQQVSALKEVITLSKQLLAVRERQVDYLKQTLENIEVSVAEKRHGSLSAGLKAEYETQMQNIKTLKALYEERTVVMNAEKEKLLQQQKELLDTLENEKRKAETLELKLQEREAVISERNETVSTLQDQLSDSLDQSKNLSCELTLINNMFTQILGSSDMDLDRLTKLLQENHDLITEITTKGDSSEVTASLPKLLLDLISDIEAPDRVPSRTSDTKEEEKEDNATALKAEDEDEAEKEVARLGMQDISSNLPKVWKVLMELISHHVEPTCSEFSPEECKASCYKSIETPYGPKNVISASKTFLRIRDLILQKTSLQKEVTRLKQLNVHLETKLNDQERRLSLVSSELRKTWNVVDQMHVQHQQLHTHEKVLRYELQQKRKMLQQLKEELEYCREKWEEARKKNCQTEVDWQNLRREFAMRKLKPDSPLNNSEESGFSDEKEDESDSETPVSNEEKGRDENVRHSACARGSYVKREEKECDEGNISSPSLPDLVTATADLSLPQSEVLSSLSEQMKENTSRLPSDLPVQHSSVLEECPTASLISLLKLQLSCFSKNLEIINAGLDNRENLRALQSIFTLPAIQIPVHLHPIPNPNYDCPSTSYAVNLTNSETLVSGDGFASAEDYRYVGQNGIKNSEMRGGDSNEGKQLKDDRNEHSNDEQQTESVENDRETSSSTCVPQSPTFSTKAPSSPESPDCADVGMLLLQGLTDGKVNIRQPQESRAERLKRVEKQCQELFQKVTKSSAPTVQAEPVLPSTSTEPAQSATSEPARNLETMLDARAARLKRLEEQSQQLFKKVTRTTHRSEVLSNRLEELHEQYGSEDSGSSSSGTASSKPETVSLSSSVNIPQPPPLPMVPIDQVAAAPHNSGSSSRSLEEILEARAVRMRRLEEESQKLFKKVTRTTHRSEALSNRLEELHEQYGGEQNGSNSSKSQTSVVTSGPETVSQSVTCQIPRPPPIPDSPSAQGQITSQNSNDSSGRLDNVLKARAARLQRLEEESQRLLKKVTNTTNRSEALCDHLGKLHEQYGKDSVERDSGEPQSNDCVAIPEAKCEGEDQTQSSTSSHIPDECELTETSSPSAPSNIPIVPNMSNEQAVATTSSHSGSMQSLEDRFDARAARLKNLEEQSQQLFKKVTRTTRRSTVLSNRLEELHEQYGSDETSAGVETTENSVDEVSGRVPSPPPLPTVLRGERLPTALSSQQTLGDSPSQQVPSSHIPIPPPVPLILPPIRIPTEMTDELNSANTDDSTE